MYHSIDLIFVYSAFMSTTARTNASDTAAAVFVLAGLAELVDQLAEIRVLKSDSPELYKIVIMTNDIIFKSDCQFYF